MERVIAATLRVEEEEEEECYCENRKEKMLVVCESGSLLVGRWKCVVIIIVDVYKLERCSGSIVPFKAKDIILYMHV